MDENTLLNYISRDELEETVKILKKEAPLLGRKKILGEIATLEGRIASHHYKQQRGISSEENLRIERNQIREDMQQFILQLYHPSQVDSPSYKKKNRWIVPIAVFSISLLIVLVGKMIRVPNVSFEANLEVSKVQFQTAEEEGDIKLETAIATNWLEIEPLTSIEFGTYTLKSTQYDGRPLHLRIEEGEIVLDHFFNTENISVTCEYISKILTLRSEKTSSTGTITAENCKVSIELNNQDQIKEMALVEKEYITWEADSSKINISFNMLKDTFSLFENMLIQDIEFLYPERGGNKVRSSIINGNITIDEQIYSLKEEDILSFTNLTNTDLSIQQHKEKLNLKIEGQARKIKKKGKNIEVLNPTLLDHYVSQYQNSVVVTSFLYLIGLFYTLWKAWKEK